MKTKNFRKILKQQFGNRLNLLNDLTNRKQLRFDSAYSFNNLLRCAETPTHFIGELLGSKKFKPTERISVKFLQIKSEKISSTNTYFMPFPKEISKPGNIRDTPKNIRFFSRLMETYKMRGVPEVPTADVTRRSFPALGNAAETSVLLP